MWDKLDSSAVRPSIYVAKYASGDVQELEVGLESQVCPGNRRIHIKCLLTAQSD